MAAYDASLYGPLPNPAVWRNDNGGDFRVGPSVPGWNQATPAQRKRWLGVLRGYLSEDGERASMLADLAAAAEKGVEFVANAPENLAGAAADGAGRLVGGVLGRVWWLVLLVVAVYLFSKRKG